MEREPSCHGLCAGLAIDVVRRAAESGRYAEGGRTLGTVESVKAASDMQMPIGGTITAVIRARRSPETVNKDPMALAGLSKSNLTI